MGKFDGESVFDLNDVWSWEEIDTRGSVDENNWRLVCNSAGWSGRALLSYETKFSFSGALSIPFVASAT